MTEVDKFLSDLLTGLSRPAFWVDLGERLLILLALLVLGRVFLLFTRFLIGRLLHRHKEAQRATTILVMIQSLVRYSVIFAVTLLGLYVLGVPTRHLLTGLGIGGLALALGAQGIIRDMISGVTILMEDALAVGDEVIINPNQLHGEVLEMGMRVVKLIGSAGEEHQVAYSTIQSITNLSRQSKYTPAP